MISRDIYLNKLKDYKDTELIKVITGFRRCGKSTLLKLFQEYLIKELEISKDNIIYMNFELNQFDHITNYNELYDAIKEKIQNEEKHYIFLDEIQEIKNWEKAINSLNIDSNVDIYITGSNAYLLSSELATLISGRYVEIKMLPLSFKEFLNSKNLDKSLSNDEKFQKYLKYGAIPLITELPSNDSVKIDVLSSLYDTVLIKDIIAKTKIRDINLIKDILKYLISNTGNLISSKKIVDYLKNEKGNSINHSTISNYLELLEKAFIIYKVPRYNIRGKEILKNISKYYIIDTGIRNVLLGYSDRDTGHILETIVYFELLRKGYQVFIGKYYDCEIDFIAIKPEETRYYQVTTTLLNENVKEREVRSLKKIPDNYEKTILSLDKTYLTDNDGIKYKNIIDFLLE